MSASIRSFIAFDIDNPPMVRRLAGVQAMLVNTGANLKPVKPQNIHVTMRFLGNISPSMVDSIHEELKQVAFSSFEIELKGVGAFPTLRYPRVVWAGIREGANELNSIFTQLEQRLTRLGFKPETRGFSPHLTLARVRTGRHKHELVTHIRNLAEYEFGTMTAEVLRLKRSVLTPKGPIYTTISEVHGAQKHRKTLGDSS